MHARVVMSYSLIFSFYTSTPRFNSLTSTYPQLLHNQLERHLTKHIIYNLKMLVDGSTDRTDFSQKVLANVEPNSYPKYYFLKPTCPCCDRHTFTSKAMSSASDTTDLSGDLCIYAFEIS